MNKGAIVLYDNGKPLRVIGYPESSLTTEFLDYRFTVFPDREVITPEDFLASENKEEYQYSVGFNLDKELRLKVIAAIETLDLNCPSVLSEGHYFSDDYESYIGKGVVTGHFVNLLVGCKIGDFTTIEDNCLVSHYTEIGKNNHIHIGTIFGGKTITAENCSFNMRSTILNKLTICSDVEVGAVSTVTKDITQSGRYIGSIARRVGDLQDKI